MSQRQACEEMDGSDTRDVFSVKHCQCNCRLSLVYHIPSARDNLGIFSNSASSSTRTQTKQCPNRSKNEIYWASSPVWLPCTLIAKLLVLSLLVISIPQLEGAAIRPYRSSKNARQQNAMDFLSKYGYISGPNRETGNLHAGPAFQNSDLQDAIKKFQRYARIPETGLADQRTLALMHKPRCGNQDILNTRDFYSRRKKRFTLAPSKWEKKTILTFRIEKYSPDLSIPDTRTAIYNALYVWQKKTQLDFVEKISGTADIMITFANMYHQDGYPFDGQGKVLAHAFFPGEDRGGDTHFDDDEHWTLNSNEGIDLFMVAAHEFGHALGLAHSNVQGALMYPWYQGYQDKFELPYDDVLGIQTLYGARRENPDDRDNTPRLPMIPTRSPDDRSNTPATGTPRSIDPEGSIPNPCTMSYDAIGLVRREVYIFRQRWFWRLNSKGIIKGSPVQIHQFWHGLPADIDHIDAIYEEPDTKRIIFFIGDRYWEFDGNQLFIRFPAEGRPITEFGIPSDVKKIDAVFVWSYNKRTYLISGDMYWKLDDKKIAEYDYPRDMSMWAGVKLPVHAAFKYWDETTYFFNDQYYWKFNDMKMRVADGYPKQASSKFMRCENSEIPSDNALKDSKPKPHYSSSSTSHGNRLIHSGCLMTAVGLWLTISRIAHRL